MHTLQSIVPESKIRSKPIRRQTRHIVQLQHAVIRYTRHNDAVARLDVLHRFADLLDDADALVAEDPGRVRAARDAAVEMQVSAADGGGRETHDDVLGRLEAWLRDGFDGDLAGDAVPDCGAHGLGGGWGRAGTRAAVGEGGHGVLCVDGWWEGELVEGNVLR